MGYNLYPSMHTTQKFYFYNSCMHPQSHNISSRMQISNLYSIHVEGNLLMAPFYFYFQNHFFLHPRYFKHTTINIRYRILDPRLLVPYEFENVSNYCERNGGKFEFDK